MEEIIRELENIEYELCILRDKMYMKRAHKERINTIKDKIAGLVILLRNLSNKC